MIFKDGAGSIDKSQLSKFFTENELGSRRLHLVEKDMTFAVADNNALIGYFIIGYMTHAAFVFDMEIAKEYRRIPTIIYEFSNEIIKRVKDKGCTAILFNVEVNNGDVINMHTKRGAIYQKTVLTFINHISNYASRRR